MSHLVGNPEDRFSHDAAQMIMHCMKSVLITMGVGKVLLNDNIYEPSHEKTNNLPMRKQRRRSAVQ